MIASSAFAVPTVLWLPLTLAGVVPVAVGVLTIVLLRTRPVALATRLTVVVMTVFVGALSLWALVSARAIVDGSLEELSRQHLPAVVALAAELDGARVADTAVAARVAPRLTMFLAADPRLTVATLVQLGCLARDCSRAVSDTLRSPLGDYLRQPVTARTPPSEGVVLAGEQYLIVSAAVRDTAGEPIALLRVGIDAASIAARATKTVIHVLAVAWALLAVVIVVTWFLLRAMVSRRVEALLDRVRDEGTPARSALGRAHDELSVLASAIDASVEASVRRARRQDAVYRELVDNAPWGIGRLDDDLRITAANPALLALTGVTDAAVLHGQALSTFVPRHEDLSRVLAQREATPPEADVAEVRWCGLDGTNRTVVVSLRRLETATELLLQDVTQQRLLEAQLAQSQKMQALGQLTGGIAHDFNNLLTVISASVPLVRAQLPTADPALLDDLRAIAEASARGGALVKKLLAFGTGHESERSAMLVSTLLHDVGFLLRRVLPESITLRIPAAMPALWISADRVALEQIVVNLATNARDAMPTGGVLTLEASEETVDDACRARHNLPHVGQYVVIAVGDSGTGIAAELHARVFEPFFTTKRAGTGTGLGLAMVYGLMAQHRGAVALESTVGIGTRITLYFPVVSPASDGAAPRPSAGQAPRQARILLVEDEPGVQRITRRMLESVGYDVTVADDGAAGLERLLTDRALCLVVSDVTMPHMSGPTMLRQARAAGITVPCIFVTGYSMESVADLVREDGRVRVLAKPWSAAEMSQLVAEALGAAL